jgi:hypothetical protein
MRITAKDRVEALEALRDRVERATRDRDGRPIVYLVLRSVARSGMSRVIWPFVTVDGEPLGLGYCGAVALERRYDERKEGIVVQGCGMDMGFELVYAMSCKLYGYQDRGGYRLSHRWL